ncbi:hypothetical protein [uncultured Chryseobacterium sp.]|uniref:hypothetical protein n=1 Tax=uncultured Chryseobacterium sp. TaxID=259322 RepID=UPI002600DDF7|nr:hypothetical protein [uncultured Chryseobacterium sp.]
MIHYGGFLFLQLAPVPDNFSMILDKNSFVPRKSIERRGESLFIFYFLLTAGKQDHLIGKAGNDTSAEETSGIQLPSSFLPFSLSSTSDLRYLPPQLFQ